MAADTSHRATGVAFTLNGAPMSLHAPPFETLAESLRERLGLTGTKIGCEAGDCGACTVLIDGAQACACLVPVGQVAGAQVETIESNDPALAALRAAFLAGGAAQCGICTPGMLMAARDLLARDPTPGRAAVEDALGGVLCRCTGYLKIVEAVLAAAAEAVKTPPRPRAGEAVGARIARLDGAAKVAGDSFGADGAPTDALWLRAVRSPWPRARFTLGDLDALVARTPGLEAVLTAKDVPGANSFGIYPDLKDQPVFAEGIVRYRGDCVLALVGARAAVEAIAFADLPITWTPEPAITGLADGAADGLAPVHASKPDNVLVRGHLKRGDLDSGFAAAAVTARGDFETGFVEHAYIEPEAGWAAPLDGGRVAVTACTQAPYMDLEEVARVLGVPRSHVRIIPSACGGGFGGKLDVSLQPMLAVAAMRLRRPVRTVYSRIESMASTTKRHPSRITARAGADAEGHLTAFSFEGDFNTGAYASWGPTVAGRVPVHASGPYRVPNVRVDTAARYTNDTPAGAFRGFGTPQAAIAQERLYDDLAEQLGMDRWAFRRLNAIRAGDATPTGQVLEASVGLVDCLDAVKPDWDAALARAERLNAGDPRVRRGVGVACMWYGCGNTSMSNPSTMRVTLNAAGKLVFWNGAVDIGQGSTTVLTQIAADALGLPVEAFTLVPGDTDLTADAGKTSASRQTLVSGRAAFEAGRRLREAILRRANAGEDSALELDGARLSVIDGGHTTTIDLKNSLDDELLEGVATWDPPTTVLDADGQGVPYVTYGFAAQIAEVEVDTQLGTVKVRRMVAAHDVGRAINPTLTEGQIHGGIAQGLGLALMEEFIPGRTENLHDYLIPTFGDMPDIEVKLIEDPEPEGPYGAKGVGEPALVATAPAIFSAIRHATGVVVTRAPALPHRLLPAIRAAAGAKETSA